MLKKTVLFLFLPWIAHAQKKWDFQVWNYDSVTGPISARVNFYGDLEFRWRNQAHSFYYQHEHVEFQISVLPFLYIGPSYRQIWHRNPAKWTGVSEPNVNIVFHGDVLGFRLYNRSRITYNIYYDNRQDVWQYRNKLSISKLCCRNPDILVFADDEFFLEQKKRGIYENRSSLGLNIKIAKPLNLEVGYRFRILRQSQFWEHNNILLLSLWGFF